MHEVVRAGQNLFLRTPGLRVSDRHADSRSKNQGSSTTAKPKVDMVNHLRMTNWSWTQVGRRALVSEREHHEVHCRRHGPWGHRTLHRAELEQLDHRPR